MKVLCHKDVIENRHILKQPYILKRSGNAEFCYLIRRRLDVLGVLTEVAGIIQLFHFAVRIVGNYALAAEVHGAVCGSVNACNHVESGGLACAVGAY